MNMTSEDPYSRN